MANVAVVAVLTAFWLAALGGQALAQGYSVGILGHDFIGAPGDVINGIVNVNSSRDRAIGITVNSGDLWRSLDEKGNYQFIEGTGKESRSLLPWLSYSPESTDLPAHGNLKISYQIKVPNDPSLHGTYWAALFVSSIPTQEELEKPAPANSNEARIGINIVFRYCALITVTIKGAEAPHAKFTNISIEDSETGPKAVAEVENSTTTLVKPKFWLQVKDTAGRTVSQTEKQDFTILPESKRRVKIAFADKPLAAGQYLLLVIADYGAPKLIGAQAKLTVSPEQAATMAGIFKAHEEAKKADEATEAAEPPPAGESNN
jgi:hypothetical protein